MIQVSGLYETHLSVSNLARSIEFYRDVVGLSLAHTIPERHVAFFWVGDRERSMLGLWSVYTSPVNLRLHIAFQTALPDLLRAIPDLRSRQITPRNGQGEEIDEPSVFPWMPAASVYFNDPDGHSIEYISILSDAPRSDIAGAVTFSRWNVIKGEAAV
jgi:lactoylglutathione lyase